MNARVLMVDCETAPAKAHVWGLFNQNIGLSQVLEDPRMMGFGAKWLGDKRVQWWSEYHHSREQMLTKAHDLLDEADVVVHYNGNTFDTPWFQGELAREDMPVPSPFKQIDLYRVIKKNMRFLSHKLAYVSPALIHDTKVSHAGHRMWVDCLEGEGEVQRRAWASMRKYCVTPNHKLLGEDLRWRPAGEFGVGDVVLGFDEHKPKGHGRRYRRATIKAVSRHKTPLFRVTLTSGKTFDVTADHQWLVAHLRDDRGSVRRWEWKNTLNLLVDGKSLSRGQVTNAVRSDALPQLLNVWEEDLSKDAGWLAGMLDGEGSLSVRRNQGQRTAGGFAVQVTQKLGPEADRLELLMKEFSGSDPSVMVEEPKGIARLPLKRINLRGPIHEKLDFLGRVRPERLIPKVDFDHLGRLEARNRMDYVAKVEQIADGEIVAIETDTGTFICDGYPMHNCKQDVNLLEPLFHKVRPYFPASVNMALYTATGDEPACTKCGSTNLQKRGFAATAQRAYQQFRCNDCGGWSRDNKTVWSINTAGVTR